MPVITTEVKDSTYVLEVPRLIPYAVPGETVTVKEYIECDSNTNKPKPIRLSATGKKGAKQEVTIDKDGLLTGIGGCDSLKGVVEAKNKEIYRLRTEKTTEKIPVYITRPIDKWCRWICIVEAILLIGYFFFRLKKLSP